MTDTAGTSDEAGCNRRRFLRKVAATVAAVPFASIGLADAQSDEANGTVKTVIQPGAHTSFASLKQIDAGLLNIGYAEDGPADGPAVILLHGWPYDICSY